MNLYCLFSGAAKGSRCKRCGFALPMEFIAKPVRKCTAPPCPHLGPPRTGTDGVPIKIKCRCSKKDQQRMLPVHTCEIFQRCLPSYPWQPDSEQGKAWAERPEARLYAVCAWCPFSGGSS